MTRQGDEAFMARALALAEQSVGSTHPNPAVGCVLVRDGRIVAEGRTQPPGGPHAEAVALAAAGEAAHGATAYVTLEPCDHQGRTGPCTQELIASRVARVVCAGRDPNPVAGRGLDTLRAAGIDVEVGVLESEARALNRGFFSRLTRGRPWVRSKLAASLDGRTALANGESQWITGADARRDVHRERARSAAIMTGVGTVLADDPSLNARPDGAEVTHQPLRVIVDAALRTPPAARTLSLPGRVVILTTRDPGGGAAAAYPERARIERVRPDGEHCDLADVLARLAELEVNDVWVEAGAGFNGALLELGLIDELWLYLAPSLLGDTARGLVSIPPLASLDERVELELDDVRRIGADLRIIARPRSRPVR